MLQWEEIVYKVSKLMRLYEIESKDLLKNDFAKLVGLAPQLCDAPDADRYGVANVVLFLIGSNDSVFNAQKDDYSDYESLTKRFYPLINFPGGDEAKKAYIGKLMVITSLEDMKKDMAEDRKYNPYLFSALKMEEYKDRLIKEVKAKPYSDVNEVFSLKEAMRGWWQT